MRSILYLLVLLQKQASRLGQLILDYKRFKKSIKNDGIVVLVFLIIDQDNKISFFEKLFLIANVSLKIVFKMFFFILNSVDVDFLKQKLRQKIYIIKKIFSTTKCIKLVGIKSLQL